MTTDDHVKDDWERGYQAGYDRALIHVMMLCDTNAAIAYISNIVKKLRQEVLHDDATVRSPQR